MSKKKSSAITKPDGPKAKSALDELAARAVPAELSPLQEAADRAAAPTPPAHTSHSLRIEPGEKAAVSSYEVGVSSDSAAFDLQVEERSRTVSREAAEDQDALLQDVSASIEHKGAAPPSAVSASADLPQKAATVKREAPRRLSNHPPDLLLAGSGMTPEQLQAYLRALQGQ